MATMKIKDAIKLLEIYEDREQDIHENTVI